MPCIQQIYRRKWSASFLPIRAFSSKHWVSAAFHSKKASRNYIKGLEVTLLDGVVNMLAIVDFICTSC